MSETLTAQREDSEPLGKAALAAGILAVVGFFGLGFTVGDWWFVVGLAFGAVAVALGLIVRRRDRAGSADRRLATIGLVLGGIVVAWFVTYIVLDAIF